MEYLWGETAMAQVYKLYRNFKHYFHSGLIIIFSAILLTLFQNCQNSSFCASSDYGCTGSVDPTSVRPTEAPAPAPGRQQDRPDRARPGAQQRGIGGGVLFSRLRFGAFVQPGRDGDARHAL